MTTPPEFRGAVPLGPQGRTQADVITCIWHKYSNVVPHPPDAPQCWEVHGEDGEPMHVLHLGGLLSWITVNLTQLLGIANGMAQSIAEIQVLLEASDVTRDALED